MRSLILVAVAMTACQAEEAEVYIEPTSKVAEVFGGQLMSAPTTDTGEVVRFSLATISAELPERSAASVSDYGTVLHEDEWRQVEFFAASDTSHVFSMLSVIAGLLAESESSHGMESMYLRSALPTPLASCMISLDDATERLGHRPAPLSLGSSSGEPSPVVGGFAFELDGGGVLYGVADGDRVGALCMEYTPGDDDPTDTIVASLATLATEHNLLLVDWHSCVVVHPSVTSSMWEWTIEQVGP